MRGCTRGESTLYLLIMTTTRADKHMNDDLIQKLRDEIYLCKAAKLDSLKENHMGNLPLAALNTRFVEYDRRIAEAEAELQALQPETATVSDEPPPTTAPDETWDIFISYQRDSESVAQELYSRLMDEGFRVWQDVHNIRHTEQWPNVIGNALRNSERLILLLTPKAGSDGPKASLEVFNEWYYFYKRKKPLHCLMVETCDPHYQLLPYQYIDWRDPAKRDWARLLRELRAEFTTPASITPSPIVEMPSAAPEEPPVASPFVDLLLAARDPDGRIALTPPRIKHLLEFESHIRRTTPVGIFDNATPEGAYDLTGNAYTWTSSIYDQDEFRYPHDPADGRENSSSINPRVLRGGSWRFNQARARAAYRSYYYPGDRLNNYGFRVVRPPSP